MHAGEVVGLAGLVGAGRTELLETIFGVPGPHGGRVLVDGAEVPPHSPRAALGRGIALVPEERHRQGLNLEGTVKTNISMGTWPSVYARPGRERQLSSRRRRAAADQDGTGSKRRSEASRAATSRRS